jgi:WD40 repeat protein
MRLWDLTGGREMLNLYGHAQPVDSAIFSPDGRHLATRSHDQTAILWDLATGSEVLTYRGGSYLFTAHLNFSLDGRLLAAATNKGSVHIWDTTPPD